MAPSSKLWCGRADKSDGLCKNYGDCNDVGRRRVKHKDLHRLQSCPEGYGSSGLIKTKHICGGKDHRYYRMCNRQVVSTDADKRACCDGTKHSNSCYPYVPGSKTCGDWKVSYCTDPKNVNSPYCQTYCHVAADPKSGNPAIKYKCDEAMKTYCQSNHDDPKCSCIIPPPSMSGLKLPECHYIDCHINGYKTSDMLSTMKNCPDVLECNQYLTLDPDARKNIVNNPKLSQTCQTSQGGQEKDNGEEKPAPAPPFDGDHPDTDPGAPPHDPGAGMPSSGDGKPVAPSKPADPSKPVTPSLDQDNFKISDLTIGGMSIELILLLFIVVLLVAFVLSGSRETSAGMGPSLTSLW